MQIFIECNILHVEDVKKFPNKYYIEKLFLLSRILGTTWKFDICDKDSNKKKKSTSWSFDIYDRDKKKTFWLSTSWSFCICNEDSKTFLLPTSWICDICEFCDQDSKKFATYLAARHLEYPQSHRGFSVACGSGVSCLSWYKRLCGLE